MDKPIVAIAESQTLPVDHNPLNLILGDNCSIVSVDLPFHAENRALALSDQDILRRSAAIVVRAGNINSALMQDLDAARIIALHGSGVDQVDVEAATARGIWVTNAPNCNSQAVAELTIGLMLDCLRKISRAAAGVRGGQWETARTTGTEIAGKTVGLIGWGHSAQKVGLICNAMGARVLVARKSSQQIEVDWAEQVALNELLTHAHIISLHIPLSRETENFIGQSQVQQMKPGVVLINTSRGRVLDNEALLWGLDNGIIASAGLDVLSQEPPPPATLTALGRDDIILTPHIGGSTAESLARIATVAAQDIGRVLSGQKPVHAVNGNEARKHQTPSPTGTGV